MKKQIKRFVALLTMLAMVFGAFVWSSSEGMQAAGCVCAEPASRWDPNDVELAPPGQLTGRQTNHGIIMGAISEIAGVRISNDGGITCICILPIPIGDTWVPQLQHTNLYNALNVAYNHWNSDQCPNNPMPGYMTTLGTARSNFTPASGNAFAPVLAPTDTRTVASGTPDLFTVTTTPGAPAHTYLLSGHPAGVTYNATTGDIDIADTTLTGTHQFTITASNGVLPDATQTFTLIITSPPVLNPLTLSYTATFGVASTPQVHVYACLYPEITLEFKLASQPAGVTIGQTTGIITIPDTLSVGTHTFNVTADNSVGSDTQQFTLTVSAAPAAPTITSLANRTVSHTGDTFQVLATGNPDIFTFGLTGAPAGVSINNTTGLITIANTTAAGTYTFLITASNGVNPDYTQSFTLIVQAAPNAPIFTSVNNTTMTQAGGIFPLTAEGTPAPTFSLTGAPAGVTIDATTGVMTIAAYTQLGTHPFTITATNSQGTANQTFTLTITNAPIITSHPSNQTATAGQTVIFIAAAIGNPTPTLQWEVSTNNGASWSNIAGATSGTLVLNAVNVGMNNNLYRLEATNSQGSAISNAARLTVHPVLPGSHIVTIANGGAGSFVAGGSNHMPGSTVTVNPGIRSGYLFDGWTFNPAVTFITGNSAGTATTSFVMPNANVTATVRWAAVTTRGGGEYEENRDQGHIPVGTPATSAPGGAGAGAAAPAAPAVPQQIIPAPNVPLAPQQAPAAPMQAPGAPMQAPAAPMQAAAWQGAGNFDDVWQGAWYYNYIETVIEHGLFQGTGHRIFSPQVNMTRGMFAQVLANLQGADLAAFTGSASSFNDVAPGAWYFAAVEWAAEMGIVLGIGEGLFAPNMQITREQMAVMLYRYVQFAGITLPQNNVATFADQNIISPWALDAVTAMQSAGIVTGRGDNRFDPQATATRAEVAAVFARFLALN